MKLTLLFFIFCCCLHQAVQAQTPQITLNEKDAPLEKVFKDITKQTGYIFFTEKNTLQGTNKVTLTLTNASLSETLQKVFAGQPLDYTIAGTTIAVKKKQAQQPPPKKSAETNTPTDVIGQVTNTQGQPLDGAVITVKRTQTSTLTNANGNFTVRGVYPTDTLAISYVGYGRQFFPVRNQTSLKIILKETTNQLDQVVVQAYGETSQRLTTGDIGRVTAAQIARQPVMNILDVLQGQIPGLIVTNNSGYASGTVKLEIRGRNTINPNTPSDPLYIIDGVPLTVLELSNNTTYKNGSQGFVQTGIASPAGGQSPFFNINPSDIESIEVLKDADATAIYGSRAANGVVLVTTKKGKSGKTHLDLNVYQGYSDVNRQFQMLNTQQYVAMREEALKNDNVPVNIYTAPDIVTWGTTRYTDWQKVLWGGTGKVSDAQTSLTGGDDLNNFRFATGFRNQSEILTVSGKNERASFAFSFNHKSFNQKFSISLTAGDTYTFLNTISVPPASTLPPNAPPIYDNQGNLNYAGWSPLQAAYPFTNLLQPYSSSTNFLNSSLVLSYNIVKGFVIRTNIGYNNSISNQKSFDPIASQDPQSNPKGSANFGYNTIHNLIIEPQIEYNGIIGRGKLNVLLGASGQANSTEALGTSGNGYTDDALITSINNAPSKTINDSYGEYKYEAVFSRLNYNWENKYILNLNFRRDGSTRFGPGKQFGNFGSIGAAYIFTEEKWLKDNLSFLSLGKLRGSYGVTGSDQIPDYQYLSLWATGQYTYGNTLPVHPIGDSNPLLQWEVNKKTELAVDLAFFKDRLSFEASWYLNRCNNQLVPFPLPAITGFTFVYANTPANVQNTGLEFTLNGKIIDNNKDFRFSTNFNISINRNKLLSYPNLDQSPYAGQYVVGQPLNIARLLHFTGVDPQTGLYTFQDKNQDGQIIIDYSGKPDDRYVFDLTPKFAGGFTTNFSYKQFDLSILFYFIKQKGVTAYGPIINPGSISNEPIEILQHWQNPGDISSIAKFTTNPYSSNSYTNFTQYSDGIYGDASFIRLQNLSLSYHLPEETARKLGVGGVRVYVQGSNLLLITGYRGIDPEVQNFGSLPLPRILTMGLSANF